jgi:lipopolysaccharide cholinephosphotransferase
VKTLWPWTDKPTGVWIDVFPLDGLPSDENDFLELINKIKKIQKQIDRFRVGQYVKLSEAISFKNFLYLLMNKILSIGSDINTLLSQHISLLKSNIFEDADYYGQLCVMDHPEKEHNPKEDFNDYLKMPFGDSDFYVMNGYSNVLRRFFGDYMQLPPEEQQTSLQMTYMKFYWKQ